MFPRLFAAAALAALMAAGPALAQPPVRGSGDDTERMQGEEPTGPAKPTPRGLDGKPDLTGYWKPLADPGKPGGNIGKDLPGHKLPFTPAGEAALKYNLTKTIDPEALCILGGIPRHDASGLPFEILHTPKRAAWIYFYNTHRMIPIDGRARDPDPDPAFFGNPIAHWEGDVMVIDSQGFKDKQIWIDENGDPQSEAMHVVERWTRPDEAHLHLDMTLDDPKFYTHPFGFSRTWVLGPPGGGLSEYACNENNLDRENLRPGPGDIRADGTRGYPEGLKLPDVPPGPEAYETPVKKPKAKTKK